MSILVYFNHLRQTSASGTVECDVFRAAALDTWYRIGFSRTRSRLKIHETTITQNLVYELNLLKATNPGMRFTLFESIDENSNGDDLELKIRCVDGKYITFSIQAKIIYHDIPAIPRGSRNLKDGTYPRISHTVETSSGIKKQIDLLIDYAKNNGFIPLYLLYNYVQCASIHQNYCGITFDEKQYGCSIISPQLLRKNFLSKKGNIKANIKFSDIHPSLALPWSIMACCFPKLSETAIFKELKVQQPDYLIKKEAENLVDATKWRPIREAFSSNANDYFLEELNQVVGFKPKFKIVIS